MTISSDTRLSRELSLATAPSPARPHDAVMLALRERGLRPRPLSVLITAFDLGLSDDLAVEIAAAVEGSAGLP